MMNLNERNIFLLDGIGALVSAIFTGLILPVFSERIGMPSWIMHCLALLPLTYSFYSLGCFWLAKKTRPFMLKIIIIANLFYCLVSGLIIFKYIGITGWGRLALACEIFIIFVVVSIEIKIYRNAFLSK